MIDPGRKTVYWVIATLSLAMLPQLVRMPPLVAAIAVLPLAWRVTAERKEWPALPALLRHAMTAVGLLSLFFSYGDLSGRRAAVSLLAVMLSLKMMECYRVRDARLVVCFSLFLCATQFLFAQGIVMPFYGVTSVIVALVTLTRLHRNEAWSHEGEPPAIKSSLFSELGFSLRLLALAVPAGLAFFLLFPRLSSPLWGIPETTLDSKTGLSDSMSPGSIQQLFMDDSPAFRVEFEGPAPRPDERYWRGPVFWQFDGKTWRQSFYSRNIVATSRPDAGQSASRYSVQMEPNERNWLFALDYPVTVPRDTRLTLDYQLIRRDPVIQLMQYSMTSNPDFIDAPDLPETLRYQALKVPEKSSPRTRELVERWRRETPDDRAFIQRVLSHFNEQPFHYSLEAPLLGRHPVDEFLFETRMGFCEHYASTFAVMMRLADIPSRIVTGYQGGWYNPLGNYLLVRQSDAHAWTEVWLPASGWTRVDPTAAVSPLRIQQGSLGAMGAPRHFLDYSWLRQARNSVDIIQQRWNDWVIEYGAGSQARLFEPLGLGEMTPARLVVVLFIAMGIFSAILFPLVLRIKGPGYKDPVQQIWQKFLKRLQSMGFTALPSSGALELADAASLQIPSETDSIQRIADLYTRCRYSPDPPPLNDLKHAVGEFRPNKKAG